MGDMDEEEDGNLERDAPSKSGRWSTAEDSALFQGVQNHLASLGLKLQPPENLPSEMELGNHDGLTGGAMVTSGLRRHRKEAYSGTLAEDSTFFDSMVDASYYVDGVDGSHGNHGPPVETYPPVSLTITPPSGSSGTPTFSDASTVVREGSRSGLKHFDRQHVHMRSGEDSSGQIILSGALFEALSVAASHLGTPVKRDHSNIPQDDSDGSSGRDEIILGQQQGCDHRQVQRASLALWPHPVQLPPSPQTLHQPMDDSTPSWIYSGLLQTADAQNDSCQIVSHSQHDPHYTLMYTQNLLIPANVPFNSETFLSQPPAMVLTQRQQQQQHGDNFRFDKISAVGDYWDPSSTMHPVNADDGPRPHLVNSCINGIGTGNNHVGDQSAHDPLNYLEQHTDYSHCTEAPGKLTDRFNGIQYQLPDQHHSMLYPPYLNFTRSPSTRHSHSQSPLSLSMPPSSRNSPRFSAVVQLSAFAALDNGTDQYINNSNTRIHEGVSCDHFGQMNHPLPDQGLAHPTRGITTHPNLGLTQASERVNMRPLLTTRESYALAVSRAMTTCPWNKITRQSIPGRTGVQAQARWSEALDPQVKKGKWSPEEDALLLKGVQESHKCWIWIADGIPGRTQRQCRTRWVQISTRAEREAAAAALALAKSQARGSGAL
ncbi:Myb-like DNA-binding domain protein [Mortierella alpina]|nr:Myb-like DNA-binding domain protein [Mortierella alpina]